MKHEGEQLKNYLGEAALKRAVLLNYFMLN